MQLSARTVTRRIEVIAENFEAELANDVENCIFFSLQMDKSTDVTNISQLAICVKMVFSDFTTKEEFLKVLPLKGSTRGEDIFSVDRIPYSRNLFLIIASYIRKCYAQKQSVFNTYLR